MLEGRVFFMGSSAFAGPPEIEGISVTEAAEMAEEAVASVRAVQARTGRRTPKTRGESKDPSHHAEILTAAVIGRALGELHAHDPQSLVDALALRVDEVPLADLQYPDRPAVTVKGRLLGIDGEPTAIQLADALTPSERSLVFSHELGHVFGAGGEAAATAFAGAFLSREEKPGSGEWLSADRSHLFGANGPVVPRFAWGST